MRYARKPNPYNVFVRSFKKEGMTKHRTILYDAVKELENSEGRLCECLADRDYAKIEG